LLLGEVAIESLTGLVDVSLLLNDGEPNAQTFNFQFTLVDPCADSTLVDIAIVKPTDWATEIWITDDETFALDPATEVSYTTTPPVTSPAACGPYTVVYSVADD